MNYYEIFSNILSENQIKLNEPMSKHTTFGIGGIADCFVQPETVSQLQQVVKILKKYNSPIFILGGGANLLVRDKGIRGVVISTVGLKNIECKGNKISVNSGVSIAKVAHFAAKNGLSGMEELSGIPGSIGGGVFMCNCNRPITFTCSRRTDKSYNIHIRSCFIYYYASPIT